MNKADARGITALGLAVGYNKVPLVKVLIEGGADVSKTDAKGSTVLHYAAGRLGCTLGCTTVLASKLYWRQSYTRRCRHGTQCSAKSQAKMLGLVLLYNMKPVSDLAHLVP